MTDQEALTLDHLPLLRDRFSRLGMNLSEYSFANLYLFRRVHQYRIVQGSAGTFVGGLSYHGRAYLMPTEDVRQRPRESLSAMARAHGFLFPIPEDWTRAFVDAGFDISYDEGDSDYVFKMEKMAEFTGRKLHRKRNQLNQFVREYRHQCEPFGPAGVADALAILDAWQTESEQGPDETDYAACREALDHWQTLGLEGLIVYADEAPGGFLLGEPLNHETFVCHFAKGRKHLKGLYEFMYNALAKRLVDRFRLLNLEQDLNLEALRFAKSSYYPDLRLRKYRLTPKPTTIGGVDRPADGTSELGLK